MFRFPRSEADALGERIAVALAAGRDELAQYDYALVDEERVAGVPITLRKTPGGTCDEQVNDLHVDLVNLTATAVAKLAAIVLEISKAGELRRILKPDMKDQIHKALELKHLDESRLNPKLRKALQVAPPNASQK